MSMGKQILTKGARDNLDLQCLSTVHVEGLVHQAPGFREVTEVHEDSGIINSLISMSIYESTGYWDVVETRKEDLIGGNRSLKVCH